MKNITITQKKTPSDFEVFLHELGYMSVAQLSSGQWIGVLPFLYTTGLVYDIEENGVGGRYCYERGTDAIEALLRVVSSGVESIGETHPTGPWIKHKGIGINENNPEAENN